MINKIYFDSCIFIAFFHKKHKNHRIVKNCLDSLKNLLDLECSSSYWAVNEMVKVLVKEYDYAQKEANKFAKKIYEENSLGGIEIKWLDVVGSKEKYSFREFFDVVTTKLLESKKGLHLADAIHSIIMINNEIENILTTNGDDFKGLETFIPIEPKMVCALFGK